MAPYHGIEGTLHNKQNLTVEEIVYLRKLIKRDKAKRDKKKLQTLTK